MTNIHVLLDFSSFCTGTCTPGCTNFTPGVMPKTLMFESAVAVQLSQFCRQLMFHVFHVAMYNCVMACMYFVLYTDHTAFPGQWDVKCGEHADITN